MGQEYTTVMGAFFNYPSQISVSDIIIQSIEVKKIILDNSKLINEEDKIEPKKIKTTKVKEILSPLDLKNYLSSFNLKSIISNSLEKLFWCKDILQGPLKSIY